MLFSLRVLSSGVVLVSLAGCNANEEIVAACERGMEVAEQCGFLHEDADCQGDFFRASFSDADVEAISCTYDCYAAASCEENAEYRCAPYASYRNTDIWQCVIGCRHLSENVFINNLGVDCEAEAASSDGWPMGVTSERVDAYCQASCDRLFEDVPTCEPSWSPESCKTDCLEDSMVPICLPERETRLACPEDGDKFVCREELSYFAAPVSDECQEAYAALRSCECDVVAAPYCDSSGD